ncbi:MAG: two-component system response regulator [Actinobacteria bacterium 13_2_20CM_2_72_6]|nr:MAG: two-component system response regulator [Actinobacteria bacterium 13_2_20CM_2_72_6]
MITTLVVDDDYRVAGIHAAYVARVDGFQVVGQAHTAAEALELAAEAAPDLMLLDLYLPDGDGLSVMRRLNERSGHHPDVLAVTAARDVSSIRTAIQLGAVNYLVKPFPFAALRERLAAYRDLRTRLAELTEADQEDVDALLGLLRGPSLPTRPAKGHSAPTLALVREAIRVAGRDLSAAEVAELVGISRPTAQRYLSYLVEHGVVHLQLRYGSTGRPEHRYRIDR